MATTSSIDIPSVLGIGSGINTTQLVSDLVTASRQPKETVINANVTTNNARISALASAKSSLSTFSNALTQLLTSTSYSGQPASNNETIASVSLIAGGVPTGLPAQIEVQQLASAQVLQSAVVSASSAVAGTGKLTITTGSGTTATSFDVTLASPSNTLADLAKAINDKNGGVTATVVTDNSGARLVLKGNTGAASAFTVTADSATADANLQRFAYDGTTTGGLTLSQSAQSAKVNIDNVAMEFETNTVTTAIPYLRIDLNSASPGTTVTLATNQPTSTMSDLVGEFVTAYNNLKAALNTSTSSTSSTAGLLSSDSGVREMSNRLATLTSVPLTDTGNYRTLADLGVSTNRDGTLSLDSARLTAALAADPQGVTQMLNPTVPTTTRIGLGGALKNVTDYLNSTNGPLASSANIYNKLQTSLQDQLTKLDTQMSTYQDQLTATYSAMQTQLVALKATQTYLTQQIASWNSTSN
jgi:flagellar hook-associated protein 2